jgi:hypothetical protein
MMIRTRTLAANGGTMLGAVFLSAPAVQAQKSGTTTTDQPVV